MRQTQLLEQVFIFALIVTKRFYVPLKLFIDFNLDEFFETLVLPRFRFKLNETFLGKDELVTCEFFLIRVKFLFEQRHLIL